MYKNILNLSLLNLFRTNFKNVNNFKQFNCKLNTTYRLLGVKGIEIKMPVLSPTMVEGSIVKWHKKEGEVINPGDMICEIQTDKAIVAMEMEEEGILAKILVTEDAKNVKIGELIALMVGDGENWQDVDIPQKDEVNLSNEEKDTTSQNVENSESKNKSQKISPSVRNLVHQFGIDLNNVLSTGPKNIHLKSDVLNYIQNNKLEAVQTVNKIEKQPIEIKQQQPPPQPQQLQQSQVKNDYLDIELSNMRKTIAKRLTESKTTIPHAYLSVKANVTSLIDYQKSLRKKNIPVSVNDLIIKAVSLSLKKVPQVNSIFNSTKQEIELLKSVDISIAVATDNGLITPIIKNANQLSLSEINENVKALANKARAGKLQPNEFIGGSFSISNLGMFNITEFSAVINPPQTAIFAIGSPKEVARSLDCVDKILISTLSYDSRVLDYETVARFAEHYCEYLEQPSLLENSGDGSQYRQLSYLVN